MDDVTRKRLAEFAWLANAAMNAIPLSIPPRPWMPLEEWEGPLVDVSDLHRAYNRLPADIQALVAPGFQCCLDVLQRQNSTASAAVTARYKLFSDIMVTTGLAPEELVPDMRQDSHLSLVPDSESEPVDEHAAEAGAAGLDTNSDDGGDEDDDGLGVVTPFVAALIDDPEGSLYGVHRLVHRRAWWAIGAASLVVAGCLCTLTWQHLAAPSAPAAMSPAAGPSLTVDVSTPDGDTTIVTVDERRSERDSASVTRVRVQQNGAESDVAVLLVGQDGDDANDGPKRRTIEVRTRRRGERTSVTVELRDTHNIELGMW